MPQTYIDVVDMLIPELQRRGIFWVDYCVPGGTYRENFYEKPGQAEPLPSHPAASMIWRPETTKAHDAPSVNGDISDATKGSKTTYADFSEWF